MPSSEFSHQFLEHELPEQVLLERRKDVMKILNRQPEIKGSEGMLLRSMARILYIKDPLNSYERWQELRAQSISQQVAIGISYERFCEIHAIVQSYLDNKGTDEALAQIIMVYSLKDSPNGPGYIWNDQHEVSQKPNRGLEALRRQGVAIGIPSQQVELLRSTAEAQPLCPLIDSLKNTRIARINGFGNSLMTLTIHDLYDHFFTYDVLQKAGILDRYEAFLARVGNPQGTDIYAREGELIASVAYNTRAWTLREDGVQPTITAQRLRRLMEKSLDKTANQQLALKILEDQILPNEEKSLRMGYIVSRILIQLMEQRRKQGFIRTLDEQNKPEGILSITNPEYMALIVEISTLLDGPEFKSFDFLINVSIFVEEYLSFIAIGNLRQETVGGNLQGHLQFSDVLSASELVLKIEDIIDPEVMNKTNLSQEKIDWILKNPGNSATQEDLC